jgi:hypothetical protein
MVTKVTRTSLEPRPAQRTEMSHTSFLSLGGPHPPSPGIGGEIDP